MTKLFVITNEQILEENVDNLIVIWDMDETLATKQDDQIHYRLDLINLIFELKRRGIQNILWTRASKLHMIEIITGTPLQYCFDEYLWDIHCIESNNIFGNWKHRDYICEKSILHYCSKYDCKTQYIIIDDSEENLSSYKYKVHIKSFTSNSYTYSHNVETMVNMVRKEIG